MKRPRRPTRRRALLMACALLASVGAVFVAALGSGHKKAAIGGEMHPAAGAPVLAAGTPDAFRYLEAQRSNRCGLTPAELETSAPAQHLQGSCCFPMDMSTYEWQVKALRQYAAIPQIPRDPYDMPVSLARRLLHYDHSIQLSAQHQATYDRAMHMSREQEPCCCHCWRWTAFRGMSKYLIGRAHWSASRVALVIDDVEGCGGKNEPPGDPSSHPA